MIRVAPVAAASVAALALLAASPARAESTRVLRAEVPAGAKGFTVENLAGRMRVRSGSSDKTVVTATVYGETEALAAKFRLENVGTPEAPVLRVRYPEGESSVRYRSPNATDDHGFLNGIFESFDGTYTYDGRRMNVRNHRSKLMYADVEVEVARGETDAVIHNTVGLLSVADLSGRIRVEVSSSDIRLDRLKGEVRIQGSSGDIQAHEISGTWASEFSSGDVLLEGLKGDSARIETSSGDVRLRSVDVGRLELRSSSGDFKIQDCDAQSVTAHTQSGDISFEGRGSRLADMRVSTGSGDVALRLPRDAAFEAKATLSSGDMHVGFADGTATTAHGEVVAYRRGSGGTKIDVETGSGNLTIDPR
jgi:DUF4097 and DUF4098 domain-containing protein YvlB